MPLLLKLIRGDSVCLYLCLWLYCIL